MEAAGAAGGPALDGGYAQVVTFAKFDERPTPAFGQMAKCCTAASPKQPFNTLCSIFVGQRAALRDQVCILCGYSNDRYDLGSGDEP